MSYTLEQIQAIVVRAKCCEADLAYLTLSAEKYNTYDISCALRKMKYINQAVDVLCRYEPIRDSIPSTKTVLTTVSGCTSPVTIIFSQYDARTGTIIFECNAIVGTIYCGTEAEITQQIVDDINNSTCTNDAYSVLAAVGKDNPNLFNIQVFRDVSDETYVVTDVTYNVDDFFIPSIQFQPTVNSIPAIDSTCLTEDDIQHIVEQLNKVCGCCDCQDNADIIKDI